MKTFQADEFEILLREFVAGRRTWDDVHRFVIEAEWKGTSELSCDLTDLEREVLSELQMAFLADSKDDPQFLLTKDEIQALLDRLHKVH